MRAIGLFLVLLSVPPLRGPDVHGWHFIGFVMLIVGFVAMAYGQRVARGGTPRF